MAGEIGLNYLYGGMNNPYIQNPYSSALSNDFMAQAAFTNNQQAQLAALQMQPQLATDAFEKQSSNTGDALKLAAVAGAGTGAITYFTTNPQPVNGVFSDNILKSLEENPTKLAENNAMELLEKEHNKILKEVGVPEGISYKELKAYSETEMPSSFSKINKQLTQTQAKGLLAKAETKFETINFDEIANKAVTQAQESTLQFNTNKLSSLQAQKAKIAACSDNVDLGKFLKENAKEFGIDGNETEIEKKANELAKQYKTKNGALKEYETLIKNQENVVKTTREGLNSKAIGYWDESAKAFTKDAPEALTKAYKNVKWSNAGKFGAIAAGVGLVLGYLFGNKS